MNTMRRQIGTSPKHMQQEPRCYKNEELSKFPELIFRNIQKHDIPNLEKLHAELFPVKYGSSFFEKLTTINYLTVVALNRDESDIIGVITARVKPRGWCCWTTNFEGYIMTLGVTESYRKRGLGTLLLNMMCDMLRQEGHCTKITLHCKALNTTAIQFYKKNNFLIEEELEDYYFINGKLYKGIKMYTMDEKLRTNTYLYNVFDWIGCYIYSQFKV